MITSGDKHPDTLAAREWRLNDVLDEGNKEALAARIGEVEQERDELRGQLRQMLDVSWMVIVSCIADGLHPDGLGDLRAQWDALMQQEYP